MPIPTRHLNPSLDYVVAKFPRFPFDKFAQATNKLGTQMKATGEVMGIGSTLEECMLKSVRSLEIGVNHLYMPKFENMSNEEMLAYISDFRDDTIYAAAQLLRNGVSVDKIYEVTMITPYFIESIKKIVDFEEVVKAHKGDSAVLKDAKTMGFSDAFFAKLWGVTELEVFEMRKRDNLFPVYKMVDTCHTGAYHSVFLFDLRQRKQFNFV